MFQTWLFLHLTGVTVWAGSMLTVLFILLMMRKHLGSKELATVVKKIVRIMNVMVHPSSVLVLVSGIFMIITMGIGQDRPFWLNFMERFGGVAVMFTIIAMSIASRRLVHKLSKLSTGGSPMHETKKGSPLRFYLMTMAVSVASVFAVILVVAYRF